MEENPSRFEAGLNVRKRVLGEAYVDAQMSGASAFAQPVQEFVTEFCWGGAWAREGLDHRTRSLINISLIAALNHQPELRLHVQAALRNGCTQDEIREVLIHTAVYAGVPAAVGALRTVEAAINDYLNPTG